MTIIFLVEIEQALRLLSDFLSTDISFADMSESSETHSASDATSPIQVNAGGESLKSTLDEKSISSDKFRCEDLNKAVSSIISFEELKNSSIKNLALSTELCEAEILVKQDKTLCARICPNCDAEDLDGEQPIDSNDTDKRSFNSSTCSLKSGENYHEVGHQLKRCYTLFIFLLSIVGVHVLNHYFIKT